MDKFTFSVTVTLSCCFFIATSYGASLDRFTNQRNRFYPRLSNSWDDDSIIFLESENRPQRQTIERNYPSHLKDLSRQFETFLKDFEISRDFINTESPPYDQYSNDYYNHEPKDDFETLHGDYAGSRCKLVNGQSSKCVVITECPTALRDIKRGIRHNRCGFKGKAEIICCPDAVKGFNSHLSSGTDNNVPITFPNEWSGNPRPTRAPATPTKPTKTPVKTSAVGQKSDAACKRYNSKAVPRVALFIQGGTEAQLTEFPHMALLGYPFSGVIKTQGTTNDGRTVSWRCGGTLISERFVLTAAHCVAYLGERSPIVVRLGDLDWATDEDGAEPLDFNIKRIILHPDYKTPLAYHDIALIELDKPVTFNPAIQPACLPSPTDQDLSNRQLIISGWGDTEFAMDSATSSLMKAELRSVSISECNRTYMGDADSRRKLPRALLSYGHVCAQDKISNADTCQGDSGGPLQERFPAPSPLYKVVGVTSIGKACTGKFPTLYAKVADYVGWIESEVWK